ncbi:MAG TPA: AraC family transcriptional regulator [Novosphingobium sp.]
MRPRLIRQVRASALQTYFNVARFVGIDPYLWMRKNNIRSEDIADPQNMIAASALLKLYEDSAVASGRPDFGLLIAESRSVASLGPISLLLRYQPTVRSIIDQVAINMRLLNDIVQARIQDDGQIAMVRIEMLPGFASRQTVESTVAIACRSYRELMAGAWQPESIHFRHGAPPDQATHKRVFGCPVEFNSEFDGILCTSASLDVPNPWADPAMAAHAQRFIDMLTEQRPSSSVTEQARQAIFLLISSGNATKEKVAENLAIHPRALQRILSREDTNFGELLSEAKRELALRYLSGSTQSVTDIALLLGYSTISSFSRWFTEEFGKSPAAWRKAPPAEVIAAFAA